MGQLSLEKTFLVAAYVEVESVSFKFERSDLTLMGRIRRASSMVRCSESLLAIT